MLVYAWLSNSFENIASLYKISVVLSGYSSYTENNECESLTPVENKISDIFEFEDDDETDFEECFVTDYLNQFKDVCENSSSIAPCLLIVWIFQSIVNQVTIN